MDMVFQDYYRILRCDVSESEKKILNNQKTKPCFI